jgi:chromosomal replication initiation ATPase DnaA
MSDARQLVLSLPHSESLAREDFLESRCNAAALRMVESWPAWPDSSLALVGPPGSGKSHLAAIWAELSGARRISSRALDQAQLPSALATGALVVEDVVPGEIHETALFHLLNLAREERAYVLLTSRTSPSGWRVATPDLLSRLRAIPTAVLERADDALIRAVLVKLFADRQLAVDETLVSYVAMRIERSTTAARSAVEVLDLASMRLRRPLTRALAVATLAGREP